VGTKTRSAGRVLVRTADRGHLTPQDVEDQFVDIVVKGRNTEVADRFRQHATEKLARIERYDAKVISIDVECSQERNPRLSDQREVIELTIRSRGPVVRAEAAAQDSYAALDLAVTKLESRLRRARDRRKVHHGAKTPVSVAVATAGLDSVNGSGPSSPSGRVEEAPSDWTGIPDEGPMYVREKIHDAVPMDLDQALYEMELVGHDFFLFVDAETARPSVVYRRRGYQYGVIRLGA
jgi:ribosomal subunit interface protein